MSRIYTDINADFCLKQNARVHFSNLYNFPKFIRKTFRKKDLVCGVSRFFVIYWLLKSDFLFHPLNFKYCFCE